MEGGMERRLHNGNQHDDRRTPPHNALSCILKARCIQTDSRYGLALCIAHRATEPFNQCGNSPDIPRVHVLLWLLCKHGPTSQTCTQLTSAAETNLAHGGDRPGAVGDCNSSMRPAVSRSKHRCTWKAPHRRLMEVSGYKSQRVIRTPSERAGTGTWGRRAHPSLCFRP